MPNQSPDNPALAIQVGTGQLAEATHQEAATEFVAMSSDLHKSLCFRTICSAVSASSRDPRGRHLGRSTMANDRGTAAA